ncbi:21.9 kDa heat shock protein-like [Salvia miltiorrhiza]|uniref:21.8 kDa heat shock protein n=1 Tax=Salvia miltiorrhiza TaxID=226208 RepID=A0A9E8JV23_SALMI|nr:21.9 kDa heat shock protein-like [Salvia miltiorrhiza]XP_057809196.1 21.9 kDa heat shock protein-like [Salvia miltiorrhiza]UZS59081.1 21.8 kDa heat shock protein [Salvia miltiorrhiza]
MERANLAIALFTAAALLLPPVTTALVPYSPRSLWDLMLPPDDPFKILEQSPLAAARAAVDESSVALARADWKETAGEHQISLDIPGMRREDIKIEVEENRVLRVSGERRTEEEAEGERWHRVERTAGKFWRQFRMPANADMEKVSARLEDGVLRISVPKVKEQEAKKEPKIITIGSADKEEKDVVKPAATKKEL